MTLAPLTITPPVARLTLNRPEHRNALSPELLADLHAAVDQISAACASQPITVTLITGAGRAFCAGMDLKHVLGNPEGARQLLRSLAQLTHKIRALPCVVLGIVNGPAIGGGCGLVTVCDLAITYTDNKMGFPEVDLGVCPAVVAPWLVRKIGAGRARQVLLTGGLISGAHAHTLGIVTQLVPTLADLPEAEAAALASLTSGGPTALAATKKLLNQLDGSLDLDILLRAADLSADVLNTPETQALLRKKLGA